MRWVEGSELAGGGVGVGEEMKHPEVNGKEWDETEQN